MTKLRSLSALVLLLVLAGCVVGRRNLTNCRSADPGKFARLEGAGIENFYALGNHVFSGSTPHGNEGFATLRKLGVKTAISVDGAAPDVALANRHGIRYVHIPVGYDGIGSTNALRIVKAAATLPGPVFVHCHHGKHRGPAAAAIICQSLGNWSPGQATEWLHAAGTATNYSGLYRSIAEFNAPNEAELRRAPSDFRSSASVGGLVQAMVQIEHRFDALKAMQKVGFHAVPDHPDATPASESLVLWELIREARRTKLCAERGDKFLTKFSQAESTAEAFHTCLKALETGRSSAKISDAEVAFETLTKQCIACHKVFRD